MSLLYDSKLLDIARQYSCPDEFKDKNFAKYSIVKQKGLMRTAFPTHKTTKQALDYLVAPKPLADDAPLRDALDDLLVTYRGIPTKEGKIRKITVNRVLKDIETILNKY